VSYELRARARSKLEAHGSQLMALRLNTVQPTFAPAPPKDSKTSATQAMSTNEDKLKTLIGHAKEYGFVFQSSEIYDGLSATYDYGPYGVELKNNIRRYWWEAMTKLNENIVGLDAAIFMHPSTWKASGHVDAFNDPLIDNKDSKKRYRADVLLEEHIAKYADKIEKEVEKGKKKFGDGFDEVQFRATNPNVKRAQERIDAVEGRMKAALDANDLEALRQLIIDEEIKCPISGTANWTEVRQFNLMFATELGSVSGEKQHHLPAARNGPRHLRELPERAEERAHEDPLRHRADRQGLPQRDRGAAVRVPHARVRADGDAVLHQARQPSRSGTSTGRPSAWPGTAPWACPQTTTASTTTSSWRTTPMRPATSSSASPWASRNWKASIAAPISTWATTKSSAARSCATSIPRPTRAMCPTWWKPPSGWTACSSPCSARPSSRRPWRTARCATCCACLRRWPR
jgi:hypothetical protein